MKNAVLMLVMMGIFFYHWQRTSGSDSYAGAPLPAEAQRQDSGVHKLNYTRLMKDRRAFEDLARPGYYNVVEVYLDSCAICRRLERGFPDFLQKRTDVIIHRVKIPEGGVSLKLEGDTREELEQSAAELNARMAAYQVCGTPHIEIYDPAGVTLAADRCGEKSGLAFLRAWMGEELGLHHDVL